jgi:hypothetical protein
MNGSGTNLSSAVEGLKQVEKHLLDMANRNRLHGLRLEWNSEMDFGHLIDPVPLIVYRPDGKMVEAEFPLADIEGYPSSARESTDAKIMEIIDALSGEGEPTGK